MCIQHCRAVPRYRHLSRLTHTNSSVSDDTRCVRGAAMVQWAARCGAYRWAVLLSPSNPAGQMKPDLEIGRLATCARQSHRTSYCPEHPASSRPAICSLTLRCTPTFWFLIRASDDRPAAVRVFCSSPPHSTSTQHTSQPLKAPCHRCNGLKPSHRACKVL